jgi:hypothetical protein
VNTHEPDPRDEVILERLRRVADAVDPVPDDLVEQGRALFRLHRPGVDVMQLVTGGELSAVRGPEAGSSRLHVFESGTVSLDVEVTRRGDFARALGVVVDSADAQLADCRVTLETPASSTTVDLEAGRFTLERVPLGRVRLVLERGERAVLQTPWFDAG